MLTRAPSDLTPTERRIRRETQSAAMRERALALRQAGATYTAIARDLGLSLERARQVVFKAERLALHPHWHDGLPQRAVGLLYARGLLDRPELEAAQAIARLSARELLRTPNFGRTSLNALCAWLAGHGLKLRPESARAFARRMHGSPTQAGAPSRERPDSDDPFAADRNEAERRCLYLPPAT